MPNAVSTIGDINPIEYRDLSGGMMSNVATSVLPDTAAALSVNLHYDILGSAKQRLGTTLLGAQVASGNCTGLGQFISGDATINQLCAVFGGTQYAYNGTSWTNTGEGGLTSARCRYVAAGNLIWRVGGGTSTKTWNGNGGSFGSTYTSGAPSGSYIEYYKEKVYIAGISGATDKLQFSSVIQSDGSFTWTTTDFVNVSSLDNQVITGLKKISDVLLVFKTRSLYRWNSTSTSLSYISGVGTTSGDSIVEVDGLIYYFNPNGIYVTDGGKPVKISNAVNDWIKNMSSANYNTVAAFGDDDHYYVNIGTVTNPNFSLKTTQAGRTFTNVWLVFTASTKNWHVYSVAGNFQIFSSYITTTNAVTYVGGDDSGNVQTIFSGNTDNGTPITFEYQTKELEFGSRADVNVLNSFSVFLTNGSGMKVSLSLEGGQFFPIGECTDGISYFDNLGKQGRYISLKLEGSNSQQPVILNGYEMWGVRNLGYVKYKS